MDEDLLEELPSESLSKDDDFLEDVEELDLD